MSTGPLFGDAAVAPEPEEVEARPLWSAADVAKLLGVSRRFVYRATRAASSPLPCYLLGSTIRFDPLEVRAWLARQRSTPAKPSTPDRQRLTPAEREARETRARSLRGES